MKYIVLDLEWNGPSSRCRKGPAIMKGEIIQIGAVMVCIFYSTQDLEQVNFVV